MSPRWSVVLLGAVIVIGLFTFPLWRGVFSRQATVRPFADVPESLREVFLRIESRPLAATAYAAYLRPVPAPTYVDGTPAPVGVDPSLVGRFSIIDALHQAQGIVRIYRLADQSVILRLEDGFQVSNAPGLRLILSANEAPTKRDEFSAVGISEFDVGLLSGSTGAQQFGIPRELRLDGYRAVVLYSEPLKTIYSIAPLR